MITKELILGIMPNAKNVDAFLPYLISGCNTYEINTTKRQNAFLAQIAHESGEFKYVKELASGDEYEGRKDLGNISIGDGVRYKGRGLIQITGRANYLAASKALSIDFVEHPELLETIPYAVLSACWFWQSHGLNELADNDNFIKITRRINGGTNGLVYRQAYWDRAKKLNI